MIKTNQQLVPTHMGLSKMLLGQLRNLSMECRLDIIPILNFPHIDRCIVVMLREYSYS